MTSKNKINTSGSHLLDFLPSRTIARIEHIAKPGSSILKFLESQNKDRDSEMKEFKALIIISNITKTLI